MDVIDLRQLDLKHLVALDAVADTGTFGRAAERLGYTQSAVSQQIASLERILGDKVFDRPGGPRPVALTPLGAELLERKPTDVPSVVKGQEGGLGTMDYHSLALREIAVS